MTRVQQFASLDEIAFDKVYEASSPYLDKGTFTWPEGVADRKAFMADRCRELLAMPTGLGIWIVAPDRFVMFSVVQGDGLEMLLALIAPDENGSRAYAYAQELVQSYVGFFKALGYVRGYSRMASGSSLIDAAKSTFSVLDTDFKELPLDNEVLVRVW